MANLSRYANNGYGTVNGRVYYTLRAVPDVTIRQDDRYYTARSGEQWPTLAWKLLGNAALWWVLADYNDVLSPFDDIVPGTVLRYPSATHLLLSVLAG